MIEDNKPSLEEFMHFGVRGMHWGVRSSHNDTPNPSYTKGKRVKDFALSGQGAVKRINRNINTGKTYKQARKAETIRSFKIAATQAGAFAVLSLLGSTSFSRSVASGPIKEQGAIAAKAVILKLTKQSRSGAFRISSL